MVTSQPTDRVFGTRGGRETLHNRHRRNFRFYKRTWRHPGLWTEAEIAPVMKRLASSIYYFSHRSPRTLHIFSWNAQNHKWILQSTTYIRRCFIVSLLKNTRKYMQVKHIVCILSILSTFYDDIFTLYIIFHTTTIGKAEILCGY